MGCHLCGRTELDTTEAIQQQQQRHRDPAHEWEWGYLSPLETWTMFPWMGSIFWLSSFRCLASRKPMSFLHNFSPKNLCLSLPRGPQNEREEQLEINKWITHLRGSAICHLWPTQMFWGLQEPELRVFPWSSLSSTLTCQYTVPSSERGGRERKRKEGREVVEFKEKERERLRKNAQKCWFQLACIGDQVPISS